MVLTMIHIRKIPHQAVFSLTEAIFHRYGQFGNRTPGYAKQTRKAALSFLP